MDLNTSFINDFCKFDLSYFLIIIMSELAIKRNKIAREINRSEKLNYFKSRRNELIASYEDSH